MEEQPFPKDENLRLILSTDQDQWLSERIKDWRRFAWAMVTLSSFVLILLTFLGLLRGLFQLRMYKGYLVDHRAFLKKYNRL